MTETSYVHQYLTSCAPFTLERPVLFLIGDSTAYGELKTKLIKNLNCFSIFFSRQNEFFASFFLLLLYPGAVQFQSFIVETFNLPIRTVR